MIPGLGKSGMSRSFERRSASTLAMAFSWRGILPSTREPLVGERGVGSLRDEVRAPLSAHLAIGAAQLGFGLFPVFGKLAFPPRGPFPPFAVAALRAGFGAASLFLLAEIVKAPRVERRSDYARLAVYALFGIVLNQVLYLKGLDLSSATHAGLLAAATPAVAYVLAIAVRRERAHLQPTVGVLLAVLGAAWVVLLRQTGPGGAPTRVGDALLFANQACYAVYLVFVRDVLERVHPLRAIASSASRRLSPRRSRRRRSSSRG
jgi:drug/metabolite transporter (DMT)-like permease